MSAISAPQAKSQHVPGRAGKQSTVRSGTQSPAAPLPPLRLTRRGKVVLVGIPLVLLAALLLSLAGVFNSPAKASDSAQDLSVTPTVTVTVQPGESLWAIAGSVAPERDARDVVAEIVQLNNISTGTVQPGQQLFIPTR
jgi:hypothetical protein